MWFCNAKFHRKYQNTITATNLDSKLEMDFKVWRRKPFKLTLSSAVHSHLARILRQNKHLPHPYHIPHDQLRNKISRYQKYKCQNCLDLDRSHNIDIVQYKIGRFPNQYDDIKLSIKSPPCKLVNCNYNLWDWVGRGTLYDQVLPPPAAEYHLLFIFH